MPSPSGTSTGSPGVWPAAGVTNAPRANVSDTTATELAPPPIPTRLNIRTLRLGAALACPKMLRDGCRTKDRTGRVDATMTPINANRHRADEQVCIVSVGGAL